jgi:hypothetical protein
MRLANMAFEELTEAMNRGWGTRNSSVGHYFRSSAPVSSPPPSIRNGCKLSSTLTKRSKPLRAGANYRISFYPETHLPERPRLTRPAAPACAAEAHPDLFLWGMLPLTYLWRTLAIKL